VKFRGQDVSPTAQGDVPSAGRPVPTLPEHDRVLVETVDLQRWVLAADPGEQRVDPSDHGVAVHPGRPPRISPGLSAHRLFVRFVPASCPGLANPRT